MMSRVVVFLFAFLSFSNIYAAPAPEIVERQIGNIQCNIDRLGIVTDLATLQGTLQKLSGEVSDDATAASGIQSVSDSVKGAQGAIGVIAKALLTGQTAPAEARDEVKGNLTAAHDALVAINSTDTTVSANLKKAVTQLNNAAVAGEGVVDNCK